jgi:hypothetical protein
VLSFSIRRLGDAFETRWNRQAKPAIKLRSRKHAAKELPVLPAKAGIQRDREKILDFRLRGMTSVTG